MSDGRRRTPAMVTAVGHYIPEKIMTNQDLEKLVDTNDEWIRTRTGIVERRVMDKGPTSEMAVGAVNMLMKNRGITAEEIEAIIVCTVTPDMMFPATACIVQEKIGAKNAWCFDLEAACSGFLYGLVVGSKLVETGAYKKVVVIGADKMSAILDYTDRNTCILFGDGAGAVLLEQSSDPEIGVLDQVLYSDGAGGKFLFQKGGGSLNPTTHQTVDNKMHYVYQDGKSVFKVAVMGMADASAEVMRRNNLTGKDIAYLVPHQANLRIIDACRERMEIEPEKVMINIQKYGNTTAGTIPLCLSEWWHCGKLKKGQNLVLSSFGAGYTWGSVLIRWGIDGPASPAAMN